MTKQYGQEQIGKGFHIIKSNKNLTHSQEGEEKLVKLLKPLFS